MKRKVKLTPKRVEDTRLQKLNVLSKPYTDEKIAANTPKSAVNTSIVLKSLERDAKPLKRKISDLEVTDKVSFDVAAQLLKQLKSLNKQAKAEEAKITDPLKQALSAAKNHFKPFYEEIAAIDTDTKLKMSVFLKKQEREVKKLEAKLESGEIKKVSTYLDKKEDLAVHSSAAKIRTLKRLNIYNWTKIPDEYWMIDNDKVEAALKEGKEVPGAELIDVKNIAI